MTFNAPISTLGILTKTSAAAQPERDLKLRENSSSQVEKTLGLHPEVHCLWRCIVWVQLGRDILG